MWYRNDCVFFQSRLQQWLISNLAHWRSSEKHGLVECISSHSLTFMLILLSVLVLSVPVLLAPLRLTFALSRHLPPTSVRARVPQSHLNICSNNRKTLSVWEMACWYKFVSFKWKGKCGWQARDDVSVVREERMKTEVSGWWRSDGKATLIPEWILNQKPWQRDDGKWS